MIEVAQIRSPSTPAEGQLLAVIDRVSELGNFHGMFSLPDNINSSPVAYVRRPLEHLAATYDLLLGIDTNGLPGATRGSLNDLKRAIVQFQEHYTPDNLLETIGTMAKLAVQYAGNGRKFGSIREFLRVAMDGCDSASAHDINPGLPGYYNLSRAATNVAHYANELLYQLRLARLIEGKITTRATGGETV